MYDDTYLVRAASQIAQHTDEIDTSVIQVSNDLKKINDRIEELHTPLHFAMEALIGIEEKLELFLLLEFAKSGQPGASELVAWKWKSFKADLEAD